MQSCVLNGFEYMSLRDLFWWLVRSNFLISEAVCAAWLALHSKFTWTNIDDSRQVFNIGDRFGCVEDALAMLIIELKLLNVQHFCFQDFGYNNSDMLRYETQLLEHLDWNAYIETPFFYSNGEDNIDALVPWYLMFVDCKDLSMQDICEACESIVSFRSFFVMQNHSEDIESVRRAITRFEDARLKYRREFRAALAA